MLAVYHLSILQPVVRRLLENALRSRRQRGIWIACSRSARSLPNGRRIGEERKRLPARGGRGKLPLAKVRRRALYNTPAGARSRNKTDSGENRRRYRKQHPTTVAAPCAERSERKNAVGEQTARQMYAPSAAGETQHSRRRREGEEEVNKNKGRTRERRMREGIDERLLVFPEEQAVAAAASAGGEKKPV
ncbi:hypothetical protein MRX96_039838 [Rhipicephalus microplus]